MGEGWEQRNAALPLTAVEAMQLASPRHSQTAFGKGANMTFLVIKNVRDLQKARGESAFSLKRQGTGHREAFAEDSRPREVIQD